MNKKQNLIIIGSTGSIGKNVLEIIKQYKNSFNLIALVANNNYNELSQQINYYNPKYAVIVNNDNYNNLKKLTKTKTTVLSKNNNILQIIKNAPDDTIVVLASSSTESLLYLTASMERNLKIAIANKESIVCGGEFLKNKIYNYKNNFIPIDSEHSAIFQCLEQHNKQSVQKVLLTASGGPFLHYSAQQMQSITIKDTLKHPVWAMGAKISVDSATLMNKALEVIEASYLFNLQANQIEVLIHPQAILHGGVFYNDGSFIGHFANPNMQVPISYALFYPYRKPIAVKAIDLITFTKMQFIEVDNKKFKAIELAKQTLIQSKNYPCAFNASNEIAVESYINNKISLTNIIDVVEYTLNKITSKDLQSVEEIILEYNYSKQLALNYINKIS